METGLENSTAERPDDVLVGRLCLSLAQLQDDLDGSREENAILRERCKALEDLACSRGDDAESARLVAQQAIHALYREQVERRKLQERYGRVVDENRELRARVSDVESAA